MKACRLRQDKKNYLNKVLRDCETIACVTEIRQIYDRILDHKASVVRYKDFCLKILIRRKIEDMIRGGAVDASRPTRISVYIDKQSTKTDGYYRLDEGIAAELNAGINNLHAYRSFRAVFQEALVVEVHICDSREEALVRASDLLANALYIKHNNGAEVSLPRGRFLQIGLP